MKAEIPQVLSCLVFVGGYILGALAFSAFGHGAAGIIAVNAGWLIQAFATGWLMKDAFRKGRKQGGTGSG